MSELHGHDDPGSVELSHQRSLRLPTGERVKRRDFVLLLAGAMTAARALRAQKAMPVIGFLGSAWPGGPSAPLLAAFLQGLSEIGYVEGQNVTIEWRWAEGHYDRLPH